MKKILQTQVRKLENSIAIFISLREDLLCRILLTNNKKAETEYRRFIKEIETTIRDKAKEIKKREYLYK
jgi:hypothetical protein